MGTWNFTYDAVDRLMTAQQTVASANAQYTNTPVGWAYDSFGNRTQQSWGTNNVWAQYNSTNNRIASTGQAPGGYGFDAGGNTLYDGINRYWYDAEGQLCAVQNQVIGTVTQYIYDAEGARIGKGTLASTPPTYYSTCSPPMSSGFTLTTRWLVGLGGDQVTEFSEQGPPTPQTESWAHSNIFSAARLTATYDTKSLHFELADPLGTKRVQANTAGIVEEWYVSLPFGDVLTPIPNPACTAAIYCYAEDATEHHFTGKERDTESGNDYFFARYYTSALGRFTSPDWSAEVVPVPYAQMGDPQSLNLYAYVRNNPVASDDPDGHDCNGWCDLQGNSNQSYNDIISIDEMQIAQHAAAQGHNLVNQSAAQQQNNGQGQQSDKPGFSITAGHGNLELTNTDTGHTVGDYRYVSGMNGDTNQADAGKGPIPSGKYTLDPKEISSHWWRKLFVSDWGDYRVPLHPEAGTDTHGRSGFFLHGGGVHWLETRYGSEGCIKVYDLNQNHLFELLKGARGPVEVTVQ